MKKVIILFCNLDYLQKAIQTILQIRTTGKYNDDIVLIHTEELTTQSNYIQYLNETFNVILCKVNTLDLSNIHNYLSTYKDVEWHSITKSFWFHKFYVFNTYFKGWDRVLYLDCGTHIYQDINSIFDLDCTNSIVGHSGLYPDNYGKFTLLDNFEQRNNDIYLQTLKESYDINKPDYFLSGFLLYDTNIIEPDTFNNLIDLMNRFPCTKGDQGILNLYFVVIKNLWKPLPIGIFDFTQRFDKKPSDYIMLKYPKK